MIFVFSNVFPMINRSSQTLVTMADDLDNRMETSINIVHASATSNRHTIYIWVKNIGTNRVDDITASDVFLGPQGNFVRIPYSTEAGGTYPQWSYTIENGTEWKTGATVKITVTYSSSPDAGTYYVKFVIPNGIAAEYFFSM